MGWGGGGGAPHLESLAGEDVADAAAGGVEAEAETAAVDGGPVRDPEHGLEPNALLTWAAGRRRSGRVPQGRREG